MSYDHELLVGRVRGNNPFGPRRELISTRDGRLLLLRTARRDGVTAVEWEMPYAVLQQYWSFKTRAGEGGPAMRQVTLVSGGRRFTVSLDREDGEDLLKLLEQHAPHAERVRGLQRYRRPADTAAWLRLAFTVVFLAVFLWQLLGHHL